MKNKTKMTEEEKIKLLIAQLKYLFGAKAILLITFIFIGGFSYAQEPNKKEIDTVYLVDYAVVKQYFEEIRLAELKEKAEKREKRMERRARIRENFNQFYYDNLYTGGIFNKIT